MSRRVIALTQIFPFVEMMD